jgi:hypothetical protein
MTKVTEVPYSRGGSLLHWADRRSPDVRWLPNDPFQGVFRLAGMRSGRSAKYVLLGTDDGREFPMFVTDLLDVLNRSGISGGLTGNGPWIVRKRGQNYGVALARDVTR